MCSKWSAVVLSPVAIHRFNGHDWCIKRGVSQRLSLVRQVYRTCSWTLLLLLTLSWVLKRKHIILSPSLCAHRRLLIQQGPNCQCLNSQSWQYWAHHVTMVFSFQNATCRPASNESSNNSFHPIGPCNFTFVPSRPSLTLPSVLV